MGFSPHDSGPLYVETVRYVSSYFVEPWNTASNLAFLAIVLYWSWFLWRNPSHAAKKILIPGLPILLIGWWGGTLYHGFRSRELWYYVDYLPIYMLAFLVSLYFWSRIRKLVIGLILFLIFVAPILWAMRFSADRPILIFFGYASLGISIFFPVLLFGQKTGWKKFSWALLSVESFAVALLFRQCEWELEKFMWHGTHFLWHIFGALSVHFLIEYMVRTEDKKIHG